MEDNAIIDLFFARSEDAVLQTDKKYGRYCFSIANNILANKEDSEESVSDTYMAVWKAIPPRRPAVFSAFLGKITRRLAIDRWRRRSAEKRGGGEAMLALDELSECVADSQTVELSVERKELARAVNLFLEKLPETERNVFLCRYWYLDPIAVIAMNFGFSQSKVTSMLHRTRAKLRTYLEKEGFV